MSSQYHRRSQIKEPPKIQNALKKTGPFGEPVSRAPLRQRHMNVENGNGHGHGQGNMKSSSSAMFPVKSSSSAHKSRSSKSREDNTPVEIEEHRRKPNGEGHTIHRYIRGKMLGKGGFAKVYLCTSLDTNRTYAVKIVPKANLVKTRARQKVRPL